MIWYMIHNILKALSPSMESQHRNLTTFLIGVVLYTLFYSYVGTLGREHAFLNVFFKYSTYILLADAFAMAILYKNFYKHTIFNEVRETMGASLPVREPQFVPEPSFDPSLPTQTTLPTPEILQVGNDRDSDYDSDYGFAKDSALGNAFTTNGESNLPDN